MNQKTIKQHYRIVAHLLKGIVTERFKRMAKDEVLFKFISHCVDPAVLVDHYIQSEKEALDLAEMSLLELVNSDRLSAELRKSSEKIQKNFQRMFGPGVSSNYISDELVDLRHIWLRARVDFYSRMLSVSVESENPVELGARAFRNLKKFGASLNAISKSDIHFSAEIVASTHALHRFLMRKHMDHDLKNSEILWNEFAAEAFRKTPELTD